MLAGVRSPGPSREAAAGGAGCPLGTGAPRGVNPHGSPARCHQRPLAGGSRPGSPGPPGRRTAAVTPPVPPNRGRFRAGRVLRDSSPRSAAGRTPAGPEGGGGGQLPSHAPRAASPLYPSGPRAPAGPIPGFRREDSALPLRPPRSALSLGCRSPAPRPEAGRPAALPLLAAELPGVPGSGPVRPFPEPGRSEARSRRVSGGPRAEGVKPGASPYLQKVKNVWSLHLLKGRCWLQGVLAPAARKAGQGREFPSTSTKTLQKKAERPTL